MSKTKKQKAEHKADKKQLLTTFNQRADKLRRGELERDGTGIKREKHKKATRLSLAFQTAAEKPAKNDMPAPVSIGIGGKTVELTAALAQDDGQFLQKVKTAGQEGLTQQENVGLAEKIAGQMKASAPKPDDNQLKNKKNILVMRNA